MVQPEELKNGEPLLGSSGRGTEVWNLFSACEGGDLETRDIPRRFRHRSTSQHASGEWGAAGVGDIMLANSRDGYSFVVVDPAVEPDAGDYVRPRRMVLAMLGLFAGFFIAFVVATFRWAKRTGESRS